MCCTPWFEQGWTGAEGNCGGSSEEDRPGGMARGRATHDNMCMDRMSHDGVRSGKGKAEETKDYHGVPPRFQGKGMSSVHV